MPFQVDLPDEVSVTGYRCVRVWVPDSDGYESALHSLLTYLGKWFGWQSDELLQGKDAALLWRAAYQLTVQDQLSGADCDCDANGPADAPCPACSSSYVQLANLGEDIIVSLCGYNPKAFKIEEGIFYIKDFCGEWVEIGALTSPAETPPSENPVETDPWSECGKAATLVNALNAMMVAAMASKDDTAGFEAAVRASVPTVTLGRSAIFVLLPLILSQAEVITDAEAVDPDMVQSMKCKSVVGMDSTGTGSAAEADFVRTSIKSAIWEYIASTVEREAVWLSWQQCFEAIGPLDREWLLALGASDETRDCDCPAGPGAWDYDYRYDLVADKNGFTHQGIDGEYELGTGYKAVQFGPNIQLDLNRAVAQTAGSTIGLIEVTFVTNGIAVHDDAYNAGVAMSINTAVVTTLKEFDDGWWLNDGQVYPADQNMPIDMDVVLTSLKCWKVRANKGFTITRVRIAGTGTPPTVAPVIPY